jgi:hypothetical protein
MLVGEDLRPGQIFTPTNDDHVKRVHAVTHRNRRSTVREDTDEVDISIGFCQQIFTETIKIHRISAKFMLCLLTDNQKEKGYLAKHQTSVVPHPPYSPDLALADFSCFSNLQPLLNDIVSKPQSRFRKTR